LSIDSSYLYYLHFTKSAGHPLNFTVKAALRLQWKFNNGLLAPKLALPATDNPLTVKQDAGSKQARNAEQPGNIKSEYPDVCCAHLHKEKAYKENFDCGNCYQKIIYIRLGG
jgi:hypothetical protein